MKTARAIHFLSLLMVISSILIVTAEKIVIPADPLRATWLSDEENENLINKPIPIPEGIAAELRAYIETVPTAKARNWLPMKTNLLARPPALTFGSTDPFLRDKNPALTPILKKLTELNEPALAFTANLALIAAHSDTVAAQRILDLAQRSDYSAKQAEILQNIFHGMGIDPSQDSVQDIVAMARNNFEAEDADKNRIPIGTAAPDFSINTIAGKTIKLSDYHGKPVLLHFWSTTCGPCIAEFPELIKFAAETKKRNDLVVIAVNLDDNLPQIEKAIEKYGLKEFVNVCDGRCWGSKPARLYKIRAMPSDVAVKSDGTIAGFQRELLASINP